MTARACFPEPPCDCFTTTSWPVFAFHLRGERGVDLVVQLAGRIVGDVEELHLSAAGRAPPPAPAALQPPR